MSFVVYILRTSKNTLYTGQTNNLSKRLREHTAKSPKSAKYLRMFSGVELVYAEKFKTRGEALKREAELKKWPKDKKESLVGSCTLCGICCKLFYINLTQQEWESSSYDTWVNKSDCDDDFALVQQYGGNILRQKKDGGCIYLKGTLCSIHKKRPESCKKFFCTSKAKKYKVMIRMIKENPGIRH